MIESVSTSLVQASALRSVSQSAAASEQSAVQQSYPSLVSLHVHVNNELNKVILEVRSNETGEVVEQYPSPAQIRAFQRAAQLQAQETRARNIQSKQPDFTSSRPSGAQQTSTSSRTTATQTSAPSDGISRPTQSTQQISLPSFTAYSSSSASTVSSSSGATSFVSAASGGGGSVSVPSFTASVSSGTTASAPSSSSTASAPVDVSA